MAALMPAAMRGADRITIFGDDKQLGPPSFLKEVLASNQKYIYILFSRFRKYVQMHA